MSVAFVDHKNVLLCHASYINRIYECDITASDDNGIDNKVYSGRMKNGTFGINIPFSKQTEDDSRYRKGKLKRESTASGENSELHKLIEYLSNESQTFLSLCRAEGRFNQQLGRLSNEAAQSFLDYFRTEPSFAKTIGRLHGENSLCHPIITSADGIRYLIPPKCKFYNRDVRDLDGVDLVSKPFDLIVIDPPWWNKYIRRSRNFRKDYRQVHL